MSIAEDTAQNDAPDERNSSAFQIKERRRRTCFVGNIDLDMTSKQLKAVFSPHGKVEKVWFRSIPIVMGTRVPQKAKIIKKEFSDQKDNKNAYVLFSNADEAQVAKTKVNQKEVQGKHLRVDIDFQDPEFRQKQQDFDSTIFIGNLPFVTNEEELRKHFSSLTASKDDGILNVRIIRDPETFLGKGIAYV